MSCGTILIMSSVRVARSNLQIIKAPVPFGAGAFVIELGSEGSGADSGPKIVRYLSAICVFVRYKL